MNKKKTPDKPPKEQTTDEAIRNLFPKRVLDEAKKQAEEGSKKPKRDVEED